jgi:hypothetical protein
MKRTFKNFAMVAILCLLGHVLSVSSAYSQSGSISAAPNPCTIYYGQIICSTTISWSSQSTSQVQIWVSFNGGAETNFATSGSGGTYNQSAPWIQQAPPNTYSFRLYNYSTGSRGALLGSVNVFANTSPACPP